MAVVNGGCDLTEHPASLEFREHFAFAQVVVELSAGRILHHQHHLLFILEHWSTIPVARKECDDDSDDDDDNNENKNQLSVSWNQQIFLTFKIA